MNYWYLLLLHNIVYMKSFVNEARFILCLGRKAPVLSLMRRDQCQERYLCQTMLFEVSATSPYYFYWLLCIVIMTLAVVEIWWLELWQPCYQPRNFRPLLYLVHPEMRARGWNILQHSASVPIKDFGVNCIWPIPTFSTYVKIFLWILVTKSRRRINLFYLVPLPEHLQQPCWFRSQWWKPELRWTNLIDIINFLFER